MKDSISYSSIYCTALVLRSRVCLLQYDLVTTVMLWIAELEEFGSALRENAGGVYSLDGRITFLWWLVSAEMRQAPHLSLGDHVGSYPYGWSPRRSACFRPVGDSEVRV